MNLGILEVVLFAGGVMLAVIQWFLKKWVDDLEDSIKQLRLTQKKLDDEITTIKQTGATRTDIKEIKDEIVIRLTRIEGYLMDRQKNV